MGLDPNRYFFERSRLHLPFYLAVLVPPEVHRALDHLRLSASAAFESFKNLEKYAAQCYFRLCGVEDKTYAPKHWSSINLLFSYKPSNDIENPTLIGGAGIPQSLLRFHVEESAYRDYEVGFASLRYEFLTGTYDDFLNARYRLEEVLQACEISKMDMAIWRRWLEDFLDEMRKWEDYIEDVTIPSLDDILWEVIEMVVERVDFGDTPPKLYDQSPTSKEEENEYDLFPERYALEILEDADGEKENHAGNGTSLAKDDELMDLDHHAVPMPSSS